MIYSMITLWPIRKPKVGFSVICLSLFANQSSDGAQLFQRLDNVFGSLAISPGGISADGLVVVGTADVAFQSWRGFRWRPGQSSGIEYLDAHGLKSGANAVSADGSVVVGGVSAAYYGHAAVWSSDYGLEECADSDPLYRSSASLVSRDGSFVVGTSRTYIEDSGNQAFTWTREQGYQRMARPYGVIAPYDISGNGQVIVGTTGPPWGSLEAFRWTRNEGFQLLGNFDTRLHNSQAITTNYDGSVIVGWSNDGPFRWTKETGKVLFTELMTGGILFPEAMADDGSLIVGVDGISTSRLTSIWDPIHGIRHLKDILAERGVDIGDYWLGPPADMSADGTKIVGRGQAKNGADGIWYVDLSVPEPGYKFQTAMCVILTFGYCRQYRKVDRRAAGTHRSC